MAPSLTKDIQGIVDHLASKIPGRKRSSKEATIDNVPSTSSTAPIDTASDRKSDEDERDLISSPIEEDRPNRPIFNAIHHCVNTLRECRNSLTGVRKADLMDINVEDDIIILVMGSTGVGKTSFISAIAGNEADWLTTDIGHGLSAGTSTVSCIKIPIPETKSSIVLVDTPGFDDPERTNAQILELIANWLTQSYREKRLINGIIYMHRITDIRFDSGATSTLSVFQQLCGSHVFGRVALTTSMWNDVGPQARAKAEEKEKELKTTHWKAMFLRKDPSILARFDSSSAQTARDTAVDAIWRLIKQTSHKDVLLLQKEMVDEKKTLIKTKAGKAAFSLEEKVVWQLKYVSEAFQKKLAGKDDKAAGDTAQLGD